MSGLTLRRPLDFRLDFKITILFFVYFIFISIIGIVASRGFKGKILWGLRRLGCDVLFSKVNFAEDLPN
jgi:hypothetical protein